MELVRLKPYTKALKKLNASEADIKEAEDSIAANPTLGAPMEGSARKLRFKMGGHGKRGGGRLIYFYAARDEVVFLLTAYDKTKKTDLSGADTAVLRKLIKSLEGELRKAREK